VALDIPPQDVITRDNISIKVNAVLYMRVREPVKAVIGVENYLYATSQLAQTTLRSVLGETELDELLMSREKINNILKNIIDKRAETGDRGLRRGSEGRGPAARDEARHGATGGAERERRAKIINAEASCRRRRSSPRPRTSSGRSPPHPAALPANGDGDLLREQLDDLLPDPDRLFKGFLEAVARKPTTPAPPERTSGDTVPGRAGEDESQGLSMAGELIRREASSASSSAAAELQAGEQDIGEGLTEPELLALGKKTSGSRRATCARHCSKRQTRAPDETAGRAAAWLVGPGRLSASAWSLGSPPPSIARSAPGCSRRSCSR